MNTPQPKPAFLATTAANTATGAASCNRAGPYELLGEIGRGGMGVVHKAWDSRLQRFVALKFLTSALSADGAAKERLIAEARAASCLDHGSICTVYDVGEAEGGQIYIAMAYYDGETLAHRIANGGITPLESLTIVQDAAAGLACAHEAGIVHRDIKPSNLALTSAGAVKILDFGIAQLEAETKARGTGSRFGTIAYMSPEQVQGQALDRRSDLWSLGVVWYEMLTGRSPFPGSTQTQVVDAILHAEPAPMELVLNDVPAPILELVQALLTKDPESRIQDAGELAERLRECAERIAAAAARSRLEAPLSSFVGRYGELHRVRDLLRSCRLLTLTGPGGTGKTRLAQHAAVQLQEEFEAGAVFVELAPVNRADLVVSQVADTLGTKEQPSLSALEAVERALNDKDLLLVLDNFEHVVAAATEVSELLLRCPKLKILVTSRTALRVAGEHELPVAPLPLPMVIPGAAAPAEQVMASPAVALFVDRARAVWPNFKLDSDNAAEVAELCVRLDGLPLALELAAARMKTFSPRQVLERLGERRDLLATAALDRPERHRTLRDAISWSFELLDPGQQWLLQRLSVFAGDYTLSAVEQTCWASDPAMDVGEQLAGLIDHSLVHRQDGAEGEARYHMLATIRQFALERLRAAGDLEEAQRAHADCFVELAERIEPELTGPDQATWLQRLDSELPNLRAVLEWARSDGDRGLGLRMATALWRYWITRGQLQEGRQLLQEMLAGPGDQPAELRVRALVGLGTLTHTLSEYRSARTILEECLEVCRELDDEFGMAETLVNIAWIDVECGEFETASSLSEEALALYQKLDHGRGMAVALNNLGWIGNYQGEMEAALWCHQGSLDQRRAVGDHRGTAYALTNLAWAKHGAGDDQAALECLQEARNILNLVRDPSLRCWVSSVRTLILHDGGKPQKAARLAAHCARQWREIGNPWALAHSLTVLGAAQRDMGRYPEAHACLDEAVALWQRLEGRWGLGVARHAQGALALVEGDLDRARSLLHEAHGLLKQMGSSGFLVECVETIAVLEAAAGRHPRAERLSTAAAARRRQLKLPRPGRVVIQQEKVMADVISAMESSAGLHEFPDEAGSNPDSASRASRRADPGDDVGGLMRACIAMLAGLLGSWFGWSP